MLSKIARGTLNLCDDDHKKVDNYLSVGSLDQGDYVTLLARADEVRGHRLYY
jgi:hypothetical protein